MESVTLSTVPGLRLSSVSTLYPRILRLWLARDLLLTSAKKLSWMMVSAVPAKNRKMAHSTLLSLKTRSRFNQGAIYRSLPLPYVLLSYFVLCLVPSPVVYFDFLRPPWLVLQLSRSGRALYIYSLLFSRCVVIYFPRFTLYPLCIPTVLFSDLYSYTDSVSVCTFKKIKSSRLFLKIAIALLYWRRVKKHKEMIENM